MTTELCQAAFSVLMPILSGDKPGERVRRHLNSGGVSVLLGGGDLPALRVTYQRSLAASQHYFAHLMAALEACTELPLLVAVDQELGGLQHFCGPLPARSTLSEFGHLSADEIETRSYEQASRARAVGINMFLAPMLDGVDSGLEGGLSDSACAHGLHAASEESLRIAAAFIRGVQRAGVVATARYTSRYNEHECACSCLLATDSSPAPHVRLCTPGFAAGAKAVMPWPAVFPSRRTSHTCEPAEQVPAVLGDAPVFEGLVVSDDLQALSILRGESMGHTAVAALNAGAHVMIVTAESSLDDIADAILSAVREGELNPLTLLAAANKVRAAAQASRAQVDAGLYVSYSIADGHITRRVMR